MSKQALTLSELERYQNFLRSATGHGGWMITEALLRDKDYFTYAVFYNDDLMQMYLSDEIDSQCFEIWEFTRQQNDIYPTGKPAGSIEKHYYGFSYCELRPMIGSPNNTDMVESKEKTTTLLDTMKNIVNHLHKVSMKNAIEQFQYEEFEAQSKGFGDITFKK